MKRPSWDEYFMALAHKVAERSNCLRRKVGAIVVLEKRILVTGYNGPPSGLAHCEDIGGCVRHNRNIPSGERSEICRALHAEQNCIIQAAIHGVSIAGGTVYLTVTPCTTCAKMLIGTKIQKVIYEGDYPDDFGLEMIRESKTELEKYTKPEGEG